MGHKARWSSSVVTVPTTLSPLPKLMLESKSAHRLTLFEQRPMSSCCLRWTWRDCKRCAGHCSGSDYPQSETVCQELRYILFVGPWEAQGVLTVFTMRLGSPVALLGRPRFLSRNVTLFVLDCSVFKFHLMSGGSCQHPIPILFYSVSFITCSLHINAEF